MGVVTSLLPGLRELRAPLAAGYLWLLAIGLLTRGLYPRDLRVAPQLMKDLVAFGDWLGKPGLLAVAGFMAYILGVLSVSLSNAVLHKLSRWHRDHESRANAGVVSSPLSSRGVQAILGLVSARIVRILASDSPGQTSQNQLAVLSNHPEAAAVMAAIDSRLPAADRRQLVLDHVDLSDQVGAVVEDLELMPVRLLGKNPELYSDIDRLTAEGEFRASIAAPAFVAVGAVGLELSGFASVIAFVLGLLLTVALGIQARNRVVRAYDRLAEALRASAGEGSPAVDAISASLIRFGEPLLQSSEVHRLSALADAAAHGGSKQEALHWYAILAKTGDRDANERFCDLTRSTQMYADSTRLGERLAQGMPFSGRLAFEFVLLELDLPESESLSSAERGYAIGSALIYATRDERTREWAGGLIREFYSHLPTDDLLELADDVRAIQAGSMETTLIYRKYAPPEIGEQQRIGSRVGHYVAVLKGADP